MMVVNFVDIKNKLSSLVGETCLIEVKTVSGLIDSVKYIKEGFDR